MCVFISVLFLVFFTETVGNGKTTRINTVKSDIMSGDQSPITPQDITDPEEAVLMDPIDHERSRYPYCIVWTPIPVLT